MGRPDFWQDYRDQWIFEALANYSALMMLESESPAKFRVVMEAYRENFWRRIRRDRRWQTQVPVTFGTRLTCSHFPAGYEAISYGRGTWLFHMLRYMMRDATRKGGGRSGIFPTHRLTHPSFVRSIKSDSVFRKSRLLPMRCFKSSRRNYRLRSGSRASNHWNGSMRDG